MWKLRKQKLDGLDKRRYVGNFEHHGTKVEQKSQVLLVEYLVPYPVPRDPEYAKVEMEFALMLTEKIRCLRNDRLGLWCVVYDMRR